jgi:hypothetical protein
MKKLTILIMALLVGFALLFSSCSADIPAPISIEGVWEGVDESGTRISITFLNSTKSGSEDNSKMCITVPELIIYTTGSYTYSDGYVSMKFINTLSSSNPEFYATMIYKGENTFSLTLSSLNSSFTMRRL